MKKSSLSFQAETRLPTEFGNFRFIVYKHTNGEEAIAIATKGVDKDITPQTEIPVRVHSACFTAEAIGSLKCDCKQQLDYALNYINQHGGIVIYLPQEGRGIGLSNKIRAYALQENGHDTIEANSLLGFPVDDRSYDDAAFILKDLGVHSLRLITNNPAKIEAMQDLGFDVVDRIPVPATTNLHSLGYLETKRSRMGHLLNLPAHNQTKPLHTKPLKVQAGAPDRPFVHVNFAIDHMGKMNQQNGQACNLSCNKDWQRVHELRERYSAVVVGAKTWNLDQPQLTARQDKLDRMPQRQPDRVIFAGHTPCSINPDVRRSFVIGAPDNISNNCINIHTTDRGLKQPLEMLLEHGIESILVEGGMTLLKSFINQGMIDHLTIYIDTDSIDHATSALAEKFPELPVTSMETSVLGNGTLLSYTLDNHHHATVPVKAFRASVA